MERLAKTMETRGFLVNHTPDSIYFSEGNAKDELRWIEQTFKDIGCEVLIENRCIHLTSPVTEEQLARIIWYPTRNQEVQSCSSTVSWKYFVQRRHGAKVNTLSLETGVARLVKSLSAAGLSTFNSCGGHGKKKPSITFNGRIQAIWFELLYSEIKELMEWNYDWKINWVTPVRPALVADKTSRSQRSDLQRVLEDTTKMADFFLEHAEELSATKREVFGKGRNSSRKIIKTMSDEELYNWMSEKYNQHKNEMKVEDLTLSKNSEH